MHAVGASNTSGSSFEFDNVAQSQKYFSGVKKEMFVSLHRNHKVVNMSYLGFAIGFARGLISVTARVATVGETAIKGLGNILGSPFSEKCNFMKGVKQLCFQLPVHLILLALSPLEFLGNVVEDTVGMALGVEEHTRCKATLFATDQGEYDFKGELYVSAGNSEQDKMPEIKGTELAHSYNENQARRKEINKKIDSSKQKQSWIQHPIIDKNNIPVRKPQDNPRVKILYG